MNQYGRRLMEAWRALAPSEYAQIPDPSYHFSTLGEEAQELIEEELATLILPPATSYLEGVGQTNAAKKAIEERVLADLMPATGGLPAVDPEQVLSGIGEPVDLDEYQAQQNDPLASFAQTIQQLQDHQNS